MIITAHSAESTIQLGVKFSNFLKEKDLVLLEGDLGGGKTTFIKGILKGLKRKSRVLSPSFTLMRQYHIKDKSIYHIDLYRLEGIDIFNFGLEDCLYAPKSITLIEWGEKIEYLLSKFIKIKFSFIKENSRKINFSLKGYEKNRERFLKEALEFEFVRY